MIQRLQSFCSLKTLIYNNINQKKKPHWNTVPLFISSPVQISVYGLLALSPAFRWTQVFRGREIDRRTERAVVRQREAEAKKDTAGRNIPQWPRFDWYYSIISLSTFSQRALNLYYVGINVALGWHPWTRYEAAKYTVAPPVWVSQTFIFFMWRYGAQWSKWCFLLLVTPSVY